MFPPPTFLLLIAIGIVNVITVRVASGTSDSPRGGSVPSDFISHFGGNWSGKRRFASSGKDPESDFSFVPDPETQSLLVRRKERPPPSFDDGKTWKVADRQTFTKAAP